MWDRLHFRTPWSKAREYDRVRRALTRFLDWHYADKRELVGIEERFATVIDLPDGEQVQLTGYADRLERDADGNIVVVDLKTGRNARPASRWRRTGNWRSTSTPSTAEPSTPARRGRRLRSGGAELVQLGALEDGPAVCSNSRSRPWTDPCGRGCARRSA